MDLNSIKTDVNATEEGVWVTNCFGDLDLRIASATNRKAMAYHSKLRKPHERTLKDRSNDWVMQNIINPVYAKYVLLDWKNMKQDGIDVPYSEGKALELLNDPEMEEFRKLVYALADEYELFRQEAIQELAKK